MLNLFARRDFLGNRLSVWVVVAMAFAAPLCVATVRHLTLSNHMEKLLPSTDPEVIASDWANKQFSIDEKIVLTWEDSSINDPRVTKLVEELSGSKDEPGVRRGGSPYVASVTDPIDTLRTMQKNGIEPREAMYRLTGTMVGAGPLRLRLTEVGRSALRKTKREIQIAVKSQFGLDMTVLDASPDLSSQISIPTFAESGDASNSPTPPAILSVEGKLIDKSTIEHDLQVSWPGMRIGSESTQGVVKWLTEYIPQRGTGDPLVESAFFAPGTPVCLLVGLSEAGRIDQAEAITAIRSACSRTGIEEKSLHLSGNSVTSTALNTQIASAAWNSAFPFSSLHLRSPMIAAALVCAAVTLLLIRRIRLAATALAITTFATLSFLSLVTLLGGSLDLALILSAIVAMAYALQCSLGFVENWKIVAPEGSSVAVIVAATASWAPIVASGAIVSIGLLGLCASGVTSYREFGFYSSLGVILSSLFVVVGLPSLVQAVPGLMTKPVEIDRSGWRLLGRTLTSYPAIQSLAVIALCIGAVAGLSNFQLESTASINVSPNSSVVKDSRYIETHVTGTLPVETIVRFDQQSQRDTNVFERMELIRQIENEMRRISEISGTLSLASFQQASEQLPEDASFAQKNKFNKRANAVQQQYVEGTIVPATKYFRIADKGNALQAPTATLLNETGDELWRISSRIVSSSPSVHSTVLAEMNRVAQDVLKLYPGSGHRITGSVPVELKTYQVSARGVFASTIVAAVLMTIASMITARNLGAGILFLFTSGLPVLSVFGAFAWVKQPTNLEMVLVASIAAIIGAQGVVQFVIRLQRLSDQNLIRRDAVVGSLTYCGPVIAQTAIAIGIALLMFNFAESPMIGRLGSFAAACIGAVLLAQIVLLPQLSAGPLGRLFVSDPKPIAIMPGEQPLVEVSAEPALTTASVDLSIPDPHIKPIEHPATKKRRASTRRTRETD